MCGFCGVNGRNPCTSKEEASQCPNCPYEQRGQLLDYKPKDVAMWLRAHAHYSMEEDLLRDAANHIEKDL